MPKRHFSTAQWLFLLTLAVRLYVLSRLSSTPFFVPTGGDMKFYSDWALKIAHGVLTDHQAFYGLPGYPFLLAILFKILSFDKFWVSVFAGLIQSAADALTSVFIWKLAVEAFSGPDEESAGRAHFIGFAAAAGWALYRPAQVFSTILMPTSLAITTFWYSVWVLTRRRTTPFSVWAPWFPIGLLIGFEAMIVATILFLVPLALAAIAVAWLRSKSLPANDAPASEGASSPVKFFGFRISNFEFPLRPCLAAVLLVTGVFAGCSPCWLHNYLIAHEPVMLSAHSGLNFFIGNNADATGYPKMPLGLSASQAGMLKDSITTAEKAEGRPLRHYEVSRYWSAQAHAYIAAHFGAWLRLMGRKIANFWSSFQYDDLSLITLFGKAGLLVPGPLFGVVAALALPGMLLALARRRAGWIIAAVLLHMGSLLAVFITERYRLAAVPGMLLLAAYGVWELWHFLARAQWAPAVSYGCVGLAAAYWVGARPADVGLYSLDCYNTGIQALNQAQYQSARHDLEAAYRYVPRNAEVNFALGILWQQQGDTRRAETFYANALTLNPRHLGAWNNLGVLASGQKAWAVALRCFERALNIDPADPKTLYLQARAYAELGQWDSARTSVDAALRLSPDQKEFQELAGVIGTRGPLPAE
jgi:tetratricopeptide (TPR) repeat protein